MRLLKRIVLAGLVMAAAMTIWIWATFPDVGRLAKERPETTAFMERRRSELRAKGRADTLEWKWVSYGRISPSLRRAVLVAEDNAFYEHEGVDLDAMREAIERDWKRRKITHGGSTITQQLAKNLYLSPSRNPLRKLREVLIARSLERHLTKKRILEIYLNVVELGETVYGAEAGARHYFGKAAAALNASEAALLAGALPNPRLMNPAHPNKRLRTRQKMILSRMKRWGYAFERDVLTARKPAVETPSGTTTEPSADDTTAPVTDTDLGPPDATNAAETPPEEAPPVEVPPTTTTEEMTTTEETTTTIPATTTTGE